MFEERKRSLFFGLPLSFTKYKVEQERINIHKGFFRIVENDTLMYRIQDVTLVRSLFERMFGLGTVICFSSDVTDPKLELVHIKNAREIKDYIMRTSEVERRKVRTLHTMDLDADAGQISAADEG